MSDVNKIVAHCVSDLQLLHSGSIKEHCVEDSVTRHRKIVFFFNFSQGWKGYSNNIYIQPIIVNHASCDTCSCPANSKPQRRLTSEDLRKQIRLREANSWITKHNDRIRSTGTLRTRAQFHEKQKQEAVKELPKQANDKGKGKSKQRRNKSKIHKGFVCRTWATNFLLNDAGEKEDDEFVPFFVRKYVDNAKSSSTDSKKDTSTASPEEGTEQKITQLASNQADPEEPFEQTNTTENMSKLEIKPKGKPYFDENNNEKITDRLIKNRTGNSHSLQNISHDFICCCGEKLHHDKEMRRYQSTLPISKHLRQLQRSRSSKDTTTCVALPIKQFPPINPLEEIKKQSSPARRKRGVLPARRPHTVDTALLSKGVILVNGHHNLPNYVKASDCFNALCSERASKSSLENNDKRKQTFRRVEFEQDCSRRKNFDEVIELLSLSMAADRRAEGTRDRKGTPPSVVHEGQNIQGGRDCSRSLSDPRGNGKPARISFDCSENVVISGTGNGLPLRTPPHSLNSEDNDSNTDSNDTGLGSEIEYALDGSAKLDVYLQTRGASSH